MITHMHTYPWRRWPIRWPVSSPSKHTSPRDDSATHKRNDWHGGIKGIVQFRAYHAAPCLQLSDQPTLPSFQWCGQLHQAMPGSAIINQGPCEVALATMPQYLNTSEAWALSGEQADFSLSPTTWDTKQQSAWRHLQDNLSLRNFFVKILKNMTTTGFLPLAKYT